MKVTINIDCSPEEARTFMGLPDLGPLQDSMLEQMQTQMQKAVAAMDPATAFKTLFPMQSEGFGDLQKTLWGQFMGSMGTAAKPDKK